MEWEPVNPAPDQNRQNRGVANLFLPFVFAFAGGLFAVFGAIIEEATHYSPLLFILVAPTIEEVLKPSGVIWLFEKRRDLLRSRGHIIFLCLVGALTFSTMENLMYFFIYNPRHTETFVLYRLVVCTAIHLVSSLIVGIGLSRLYGKTYGPEETFELEEILPYLIGAIALHGGYNLIVLILQQFNLFALR